MVAPAQHVRAVSEQLKPHLRSGQPIVLCAKGIEQTSGRLMGDVLGEILPEAPRAVLSGPSFAADVARGLPTALTIACASEAMGRVLAERLGNRNLRLYWTSDLVGVELGGALKNVLAIAAGIVDGKGLGASAHAALVTRGFCGAAPLRRGSRRAPRNAHRALRPRRPHPHVRQSAVAQHVARPRAGPGPDISPRRWADEPL